MDLPERTSRAYGRAGLAITITTLTNLLSFGLGAAAPFTPTRLQCAYAALCVTFCYLTTITFYGGCLALSGHLERMGRHGIFPWIVVNQHNRYIRVSENNICCWERLDSDDGEYPSVDRSKENTRHQPARTKINFIEWIEEALFDKLLRFLSSKRGYILLAIIYLVYLIPALYGITRVDKDTNSKNFFHPESEMYKFISVSEKYFSEYQMRVQVVIPRTLDYSNPKVQHQIEDLMTKIENIPLIADSNLSESWLRHYLKYRSLLDIWKNPFSNKESSSEADQFIPNLKNTFLKIPGYKRFTNDIVFNENSTQIIASRFYVQSKKANTYNNVLDIMKYLQNTISNSSIPDTFAYYHMFLLFEHIDSVIALTTKGVLTAIGVMLICAFFLIPSLKFVLIIGLVVISVESGIVGYMALCGLRPEDGRSPRDHPRKVAQVASLPDVPTPGTLQEIPVRHPGLLPGEANLPGPLPGINRGVLRQVLRPEACWAGKPGGVLLREDSAGHATWSPTGGNPRDTDGGIAALRPAPCPRFTACEPGRMVPTSTTDPRNQCTISASPRETTAQHVRPIH
ncbi:daf-6 [Cordylochernes scorpioides]|uniref:Daf-6 n=1 Tax=Cordylochernes scorpioides TaxID=51811 RepID=A0ABY6LQZ9_9ARAC|nr:daf-6 [Cordylochernes scorpioides]